MNETMRVPVCYFEYFINEVLLPYYMKENLGGACCVINISNTFKWPM